MPRMRILTASEQEAFDRPPVFDHRERKQYFSLPKGLMDIATTLRSPISRIGFLLMCGYFKVTKRFYLPQDFHERDIEAVTSILTLQNANFTANGYPKQTRARHQKFILDFYGFAPFNEKAKTNITAEVSKMARTHLKPKLIFDRCVDFLIQQRIQIPTVRSLTDIIRPGIQVHKAKLITLMGHHLTNEACALLDGLFTDQKTRIATV